MVLSSVGGKILSGYDLLSPSNSGTSEIVSTTLGLRPSEKVLLGEIEIWVERVISHPVRGTQVVLGLQNINTSSYAVLRDIVLDLSITGKFSDEKREQTYYHRMRVLKLSAGTAVESSWENLPYLKGDTCTVSLHSVTWMKNLRRVTLKEKEPLATWRIKVGIHSGDLQNPYSLSPLTTHGISERLFQDPFVPYVYYPQKSLRGLPALVSQWIEKWEKVGKPYLVVLLGEARGGKTTILWHVAQMLEQAGFLIREYNVGVGERYQADKKIVVLIDDYPSLADEIEEVQEKIARLMEAGYEDIPPAHIAAIIMTGDSNEEGVQIAHNLIDRYADRAEQITIPWLDKEAVQRLVRISGLYYDSTFPDLVHRWSGGHPFLVELVLYEFYAASYKRGYMTKEWAGEILWKILEVHHPTMEQLWAKFSYEEQQVLISVAYWHRIHQGPVALSDVIAELENKLNPAAKVVYTWFPRIVPVGIAYGVDRLAERIAEGVKKLEALQAAIQALVSEDIDSYVDILNKASYTSINVNALYSLWESITSKNGMLSRLRKIIGAGYSFVNALKRSARRIDDMPLLQRQRELSAWEESFDEAVRQYLLNVVEWEGEDGQKTNVLATVQQCIAIVDEVMAGLSDLALDERERLSHLHDNLTRVRDLIYKLGYKERGTVYEVFDTLLRRGWLTEVEKGLFVIRPYLLYMWLILWEPQVAQRLVEV